MDNQKILEEIKKSKNYSQISDFTINRLINNGIVKYKKEKEVIQYIKKELHIIWGAFFKKEIIFEKYSENPEELITLHSSTEERKNFVNDFYKKIFENILEEIHTIADYGCGLNPLNIPFMNLKENTNYFAYDIYEPEITFLHEYGKKHFTNINFFAEVRDIFQEDTKRYDLVFLLKILPVLEEQKKGSSSEILQKLNTKYFVVSFPLKTLSGNQVGMENFYTNNFENVLNELGYTYNKLSFENELVYVVKK